MLFLSQLSFVYKQRPFMFYVLLLALYAYVDILVS